MLEDPSPALRRDLSHRGEVNASDGDTMPTEKFQFTGEGGHQLAAALDLPDGEPIGLRAVRALLHLRQGRAGGEAHRDGAAAQGIATLRFDFTGLGSSEGDFANATFSSNVADLVARRRPSAQDAQGAGDPDRPQPRRRRDPRRRRTDSGSKGGRHHRRAVGSRACHGPVQGSCRAHPRARQGRGVAGGAALHHQARVPRRRRRAAPARPGRAAAQGAAGDAVADRRHRRHRQRHAHLRRRETPEELRVAVGRRSSAEPAARFHLCRRHDRGLGDALYRSRRGAGRRGAGQAAAGRGAGNPQRQVPETRRDRPASSARRRAASPPAATTADPALTISC